MTMLTLASPAKINLFLKVVSKRQDGYHNLASLFQTVSLYDTLHIDRLSKDSSSDLLTCTDKSLPLDHRNLAMKAINLFRLKTGIDTKFTVHLEKNIPHEAGLGGGSSNAATTLWACNKLTQSSITDETLAAWGSEIGSDIPFFFSHGTAYCTGRGEIVQDLAPLKKIKITIVKPSFGLSTPQVFGKLNISTLPQNDPDETLDGILKGLKLHFNDLEIPAFEAAPELSNIKTHLLKAGYETVLMSGSGSSLFCLGDGVAPLGCYETQAVNRKRGTWDWE